MRIVFAVVPLCLRWSIKTTKDKELVLPLMLCSFKVRSQHLVILLTTVQCIHISYHSNNTKCCENRYDIIITNIKFGILQLCSVRVYRGSAYVPCAWLNLSQQSGKVLITKQVIVIIMPILRYKILGTPGPHFHYDFGDLSVNLGTLSVTQYSL